MENRIMEAVVNQSPIMERRKIHRCIHIACVVISCIRLVCMVALIIMYVVMMSMGWIPKYIEFVEKYTFKDFVKDVPFGFEYFSLAVICIRTVLFVILLLGIHLKKRRYMLTLLVKEMSVFIIVTIFCVTCVSIHNLEMGNWILGTSQILIGYTYITFLFISLYITVRCGAEISRVKRMAETSANTQSEFIELATRN